MNKNFQTSGQAYSLSYINVRNISSPDDLENNRKVYVGKTLLQEILDIDTDENVREFLPEGKKRSQPTQVHRAIYDTLANKPEDFSVLNSGVAIVARNCEIDDKNRIMYLERPSIINGAQTQGVIKQYYENRPDSSLSGPFIKFEVIVTDDEDLIAEVSIARNFQNDVLAISIIGRRGHFDELTERIEKAFPGKTLRKKETDHVYPDSPYESTEKLIQVVMALTPNYLWPKAPQSKAYTYSQKTKCLKDFDRVYKSAKGEIELPESEQEKYQLLYKFFLDIAPQAFELYEKWKNDSSILKHTKNVRNQPRDPNHDGVIFPIIAAHSEFVRDTTLGWSLVMPQNSVFDVHKELDAIAKSVYQNTADANPNFMGKSRACYEQISQVASLLARANKS